jgi:hypothetical protein
VADGVKCGPHGGNNSETKSCMICWLSLETKVKPGIPNHGSGHVGFGSGHVGSKIMARTRPVTRVGWVGF